MKRTLITSALPYANGYLHLGHCAGAYLPADIYARYLRLSGEEVLWICGSDEHGVAITIAADKEKVSPQEIIDKYHFDNKNSFEKFGMTFELYSRTSLPLHHETAKEFFGDFLEKGLLSEKEEEQFFDEKAQMFLPDRYVEGECPNCGTAGARGDQCDSCGAYYNQTELKNPISLISGKTPIVKKTTHWYMRFDMFQEFLEGYIESHSNDWKDNVLQQTRSWLKQGLNERAITRDLNWGVKIDDIKGIPPEKTMGKVLYVWFEAVLGYISATKDLYKNYLGKPEDAEWQKWWKDKETNYIAFIGKDNIVFHTLIFPALLYAKGDYILPENVPANEFLNLEGQKFSKSKNWSIDLRDFFTDFPDNQYVDTLRYTLAMNFPETKDADFTWKDFQARNNNELASILGNFVNRSLQFIHKNFEGKVPTLSENYNKLNEEWSKLVNYIGENPDKKIIETDFPPLSENDIALLKALALGIKKIGENYRKFRFRDAISETMNIARAANKYFNDEEPWKTSKNNPEKCAKSLYICCQMVSSLAILFAPIIPITAGKIFAILGKPTETGNANAGIQNENHWEKALLPTLSEGYDIKFPEILFARIEDETVKIQSDKLGNKQEAVAVQPDNLIEYDDFKKVELRTGKIITAEKIEKSKKLLKLMVDIGTETRHVIAGIAEHYSPEEMVGKTVIVVTNLKPAKLMGQESRGMILAASTPEGLLSVLIPEKKEIVAGAEVR